MTRHVLSAALVLMILGLLPADARAQFETPNRSFHNGTAWPLQGKHAAVPCESCHLKKQFKGTPKTCFECHWIRRKDDRFETRLGTQCEQCHRPTSWTAVRWNHTVQAGARLNASHSTLACQSCHRNGYFRSIALQCVSCHQKDYNATRSPNHAAAGFPITCSRCHQVGDATWRPRGGEGFVHAAIYPLVGTHATLACQSCHRNNIYRGTPRDCIGCHQTAYNATKNPNHAAAGFPTACETCHRPTDPTFTGATFNHNSVYPLVGVHASQACQSCHKSNVYRGTPRDCIGCHQPDYNRTQTPNHAAAGFPTACEQCHRPTDPQWRGTGFNHNAVFQLQGVHASQACQTCHKNNVYRGTPRDCIGCHQADYNRTQTPNHAAAGFPTACEQCHRPTDPQWRGTGFNHNAVFQLQGTHASQACATCHKNNVYRGTPRDCIGCHQEDYNRTQNPNHAAARFATTCESCHRATDPQWGGSGFNHSSIFPLVGVHGSQACATCHKNNVFRGTSRDCVGCHLPNYNATKNPNHAAAGIPTTCETCHRATDPQWSAGGFNHNSVFQLLGVHASQACASCHRNNVFKGTPRDCVGCHQADYNATKNPNHAAAGFATTCETCHRATDSQWTATFNHNSIFPLVGVHGSQACATCHKNNVYRGTPRDCVGCHLANYNATKNPNHAAAGIPTTCETCHRATDPQWSAGGFNHNSVFQLLGVHATQACTSCHRNNVFKGTPRDCVGCHQAKYNATKNPPHAAAGFPTTCESCHRATDPQWTATFNHTSIFPLVGVHASQACATCHRNNVFKGTPRDCVGCHQAKYNATKNPPHAAAGFPTTCESCHRATDPQWTATFNHNSIFPLVGVHASQACATCHRNNVFKGTPRDCVGCHQAKYNATKNPPHAAAGFPTTCETCHKATDPQWTATFNHAAVFPLVGVHASQACATCHKNNVYKGTPRDCYGCHQAKYAATKNPPHAAAGFPTTCETCHKATDAQWTGATFNHAAVFPLVGVHATQACATCHVNNVYRGTPRTCVGCHQAKYNATKNPPHAAAGFPTTCETCHRATDPQWTGATFNHTAFFPLVGVHASQACAACHKNNVYKGTPRDCVGCHLAKYNAAQNPNHLTAGFPTTCSTCHKATDSTWQQGLFTHKVFRMTGPHNRPCQECHTTPNNFAIYACIACHSRTKMDDKHKNMNGYRYESTTCTVCHPDGRKD